jgi:hypothetical protein
MLRCGVALFFYAIVRRILGSVNSLELRSKHQTTQSARRDPIAQLFGTQTIY